ncbi:XrtA/PEP-CTERM system-associated ATPase [Arsukibacterium sp.]|uniref:XrtA/PEP-CTERM system-associated ATPase n=1 Tax=Arsukibacterium sp. TaxID=1977258 RepID=UPI00299E2958|nr:XrtA/PEP-CTERM system-associated ATPase [Arsukibacterium sp.]MDX1678931.1 XrtA-associated ATPase [Arsukibacterium sp.]
MYESYYGLKERPFQLTPNPNWFFASKLHKRALAYLQYGLTQGEGFIVITGDVGTGKTTIANQLLNQLNQDEIVAKQIVTSKLAPDDLIRMIASSFNLVVNEHNKASYLDAIYNYLKRLHAQHRRALLLVDEAQNLPLESIEELRMLSNFQVNGKPLLQSFLLGQNELNPIIQAPNMEQFRQRIIASSNLTALQTDETQAYIEFRLNQAGARDGLIAEACYPDIQQFSRGIPRKINLLMDRVMLYGYLEDLTTIERHDVQTVISELSQEVANQVTAQPSAETSDGEQQAKVLKDINALLDSSLEQKVKLARELDQLLKKQKQILDSQPKEN